jgi:hypothetical protein
MNIAVVFVTILAGGAAAQTCNPVIDGTYCKENMQRASDGSATSGVSQMPGTSFGNPFSTTPQTGPAMLGAITFNGDGSRCLGLLRRYGCN